MSVLKVAVVDTPTLQVMEPHETATITVASGLDGRRGSYIFAGTLIDPSTANSYIEITSNADVMPLEYDFYISTTDSSQWQYRYNGTGQLQWYFLTRLEAVQVLKAKFLIEASHPTSFDLVHNFNTRDVNVFLYRNVAPYVSVGCYVERTSLNKVTLKFSNAETQPTALTAIVIAYL